MYNIVEKRISFLMVLLVESNLEMMKGCRTATSADLSVRGDKSSLCRALKGPCHSCGNEGDAPASVFRAGAETERCASRTQPPSLQR